MSLYENPKLLSREEAEFRVRSMFHGSLGYVPFVQLLQGLKDGQPCWLGVAQGLDVFWRVFVFGSGSVEWKLFLQTE
jgi:hypothetical protein